MRRLAYTRTHKPAYKQLQQAKPPDSSTSHGAFAPPRGAACVLRQQQQQQATGRVHCTLYRQQVAAACPRQLLAAAVTDSFVSVALLRLLGSLLGARGLLGLSTHWNSSQDSVELSHRHMSTRLFFFFCFFLRFVFFLDAWCTESAVTVRGVTRHLTRQTGGLCRGCRCSQPGGQLRRYTPSCVSERCC